MFIVSLSYIKDLSEIDKLIDAHVQYLERYYSLNKFVVSGRKVPRSGGVILVNSSSIEEVNKIIEEDPFFQANAVKYDITEFIPTMTAKDCENFKDFI